MITSAKKVPEEKPFEFGFYTFGDIVPDKVTGIRMSPQERIHDIIQAAKLADEVGLDVVGIGEHHTHDWVVSAPAVLLTAIAQATQQIRLSSAVAVLSTQDPVRLFEEFATLDLISSGRAEILAGRGSTIESFPLFGYDLNDYNELFDEKIRLLLKLNTEATVTWKGRFRPALNNAEISPRPLQPLPIWIGVGGTPESAARAGELGVGMNIAILGGPPERFKHLVEIYKEAGEAAGHHPSSLKVAVSSLSYVAKTSQQARDEFYPPYAHAMHYLLKKTRKGIVNISRSEFDQMTGPGTALSVGSPQEMIDKVMHQYELFGHRRYILQMDQGGLPFAKLARSIELIGTVVAPVVRKETMSKVIA